VKIESKRVKIYFRNGLVEEGIVVSWSETKTVIKAISSDNVLIILNTSQDVIAVKVFSAEVEEKPSVYVDEPIEVEPGIRDHKTRIAKLAELRLMRADMEKERARELMTTFKNHGTTSLMEHYGTPSRLQQPPNFSPRKKSK
jgi:hypothetical protein